MSKIYADTTYPKLFWMEFDGTTWESFNILLDEFIAMLSTFESPVTLVFDAKVDMPRGNPMPHINRMTRLIEREDNFDGMIAIVPSWMRIAAAFSRITLQLFKPKSTQLMGTVVTSREEALAEYAKSLDKNEA